MNRQRVPGLIMFDLDGTLADTAFQLGIAVNAALRDLGKKEISMDALRSYIGNGATMLLARALAGRRDISLTDVDDNELSRARSVFNDTYLSCCDCSSRIYPGVADTLSELKKLGIRLAVVTNKPHRFIEPVLEPSGLLDYFDFWLGSEVISEKKPDKAPLLYTASRLGISIDDSWMVGDSVNDILAAVNAGIPGIALTFGYNQGVDFQKLGAYRIIDDFREILAIIKDPD